MYGYTSGQIGITKLGYEEDKYGFYGMSEQPTKSAYTGTVVAKTSTTVRGFTMMPRSLASGTTVSSSTLFRNAAIGALFYLYTEGEQFLPITIGVFVGAGSQVYQKQVSSGDLTPVDCWAYNGSSWQTMNT